MRPIFPVPIRNGAGGFTFVETMVALVVCVILLSVVSKALITSLRAEQTAAWLQQGSLTCDRIAAAHVAGLSVTDIIAGAGSSWEIVATEIPDGDIHWRVWSVSPVDRPSLMVKTTFRER
ncbi:MAG: prepilin-type N-terminal cleavage/methylation domain-containing protein [bacterium]